MNKVTLHALYKIMDQSFEVLINSYVDNKIGIDLSFLDSKLTEGLRQNIKQLQHDNLMVTGGTGNEAVRDVSTLMRGDSIYWMDSKHDNIFEQEFLHHIDQFVEYLNRYCYTGINAHEFHYAVYETGCFYKRHKDQFKNDSNRKFSLINYLNEDWIEADGGDLLVYPDESMTRIRPSNQTAVFFKSDELEHEVSVAHRSRMSITGWLKRM